ncbi:GNAT family N-acetyltransferase [Roseiconus lacunae]|uniref:GNAT family protein n=1 Tax=Roseiconus lacunae TaxID=2605694 RepID=A0ABT7PSG8_9BACT|nr:GNAT family protein [Roseiconus lacunae]MDM4019400.1 GNAT family protein [Roseiconus lacunae]
MAFRLVEIDAGLVSETLLTDAPELLADVVLACKHLYSTVEAFKPWICYLAEVNGSIVGTCGFKGPPSNGRAEIAYFTFPGNESRGIATKMGRSLIEMAKLSDQTIQIVAQTLPDRNASHRVLEKLGFRPSATIQHVDDGEVLEWIFEPA